MKAWPVFEELFGPVLPVAMPWVPRLTPPSG